MDGGVGGIKSALLDRSVSSSEVFLRRACRGETAKRIGYPMDFGQRLLKFPFN